MEVPHVEAAPWSGMESSDGDCLWFMDDIYQRHTLAPGQYIDALCIDKFGDVCVKKSIDCGLYFSYISPIITSENVATLSSWALKHDLILSVSYACSYNLFFPL